MATFRFIFNQVAKTVSVEVTPTAGATTGHYAFEITSPLGVIFKAVNADFFTSPATYSDMDTIIGGTWGGVALPLSIDGSILLGTYKFRTIAYEEGSFGINTMDFSAALNSYTIQKPTAKMTLTQNVGANTLVYQDATTYPSDNYITSRLFTATPVNGGASQTSTTAQLVVTPIANYKTTFVVNGYSNTIFNAVYLVGDYYTATTTILETLDYMSLADLICKARAKLKSLDDVFCKEGRRLTDSENALYLRISGLLGWIGAALHCTQLECSVQDAILELSKLLK